MIPRADLLDGDEIISAEEILNTDDPIYDPSSRPSIEAALALSSGEVAGWVVPFASGTFEHHADIAEQGLFRCLFGRDSLIISSLLTQQNAQLQLNTVCALAAYQGKAFDSASEEEPGRIAHEIREVGDPQAARIEAESGWKFPYYGSVDATLLWLIALDELAQRDPSILERQIAEQSLSQRAELAATWVLNRLQSGDGYVRSTRANARGILNQVWKDSGDSYLTSNGKVATESGTVSVETVSQTFDALLAASRLSQLSSHRWAHTPTDLIVAADQVRASLLNSWWLSDRFAMGLGVIEGEATLLDAIASNQWRLLDSEILAGQEHASFVRQLVESVTDDEILGPNGIRTLGKSNPRYRPGGYHSGSSWPMDAALITRGLLRHGANAEARMVADRSIRAIEGVGAYPELFRSDESEKRGVSRFIIDVRDAQLGTSNRICQPPQLLQGWTIAAFSWFKQQQFGGN
jgi:glycogen debranching enzyme